MRIHILTRWKFWRFLATPLSMLLTLQKKLLPGRRYTTSPCKARTTRRSATVTGDTVRVLIRYRYSRPVFDIHNSLNCEEIGTLLRRDTVKELVKVLPGGSLDLSISMATTFMINTQIGHSNSSCSLLTKAIALRHWHSNLLRSGYARRNSLLTFDWNFFISNTC